MVKREYINNASIKSMKKKVCPGYRGHPCGKLVKGKDIYCSSNCKGKAFEDEVEDLLKLLGYSIKRNIEIDGTEVDLYAELHGGIEVTRIIVECKNKVYDKRSAIKDLREFGGLYVNLRNKQEVDHAYFVTRKKITPKGRIFAEENGIYAFTIDELASKLIDFSPYISSFIYDYEHFAEYSERQRKPIVEIMERSNLFKYYVDLDCFDIDGKIYSPIDSYIEEWLTDDRRNHLCILGDYGTGKSTFGLYLTYQLLKEYEKDSKRRIPFFVPLCEFQHTRSIPKMIEDLCLKYGIRNATYSQFKRIVEAGRLVIIFDAFDEMATMVDKRVIIENFKQLNELVLRNSKTIVTSRTHFFRSQLEIYQYLRPSEVLGKLQTLLRKDINFEIVELNEFDDHQIVELIKKHTEDWKKYLETIKSTYNLEDLSRRPILLEMIISTLPELLKLGKEKIDAVSLYEVYTDFWISREEWRSVMTPEEKALLMEELALELFQVEKYQVHFTRLIELVKDKFKSRDLSSAEIDFFDNDTRTCSFLKRDATGNYHFVHKSFMEYFLAKRIYNEIKQGKLKIIDDYLLTHEVQDFLGQLAEKDKDIEGILSLKEVESDVEAWYSGRNIVETAITTSRNLKGKNLSHLKLFGCKFSEVNFNSVNLSHANLGNAEFSSCEMEDVDLTNAYLTEAKFLENTNLTNANFSSSVISFAQFRETNLDNAIFVGVDGSCKKSWRHSGEPTFLRCSLRNIDFTDADLRGIRFVGTNLTGAKFNGANLEGVSFENCQMNKADFKNAIIIFEDVVRYRSKKKKDGTVEKIKIVTKRKTQFDEKSIEGALFSDNAMKEIDKQLIKP